MANFNTYGSFKTYMDQLSNSDRCNIVDELLPMCVRNLSNPTMNRSTFRHIHSAITTYSNRTRKRIPTSDLFKIWLCAMSDIKEINKWQFNGKNIYKPSVKDRGNTPSQWRRKKPRRETIRDCNGDAIPRKWLDRFAPSVKTQEDWQKSQKNLF